jgi:nucleoside-diphosphate-sugar epimerase
MISYFIFGGSGFIGTHLVNVLKMKDDEACIYNLDIIKNNHNGQSIFIPCDVRRKIEVDVPVSQNDIIFNLAAKVRFPGHPDREYFETNVCGAENVCVFAEEYGIRKIIFTSSMSIYGASEELKTEDTLPTPNTPYGISKLIAEGIHLIWQTKKSDRQLFVLRPSVVFGKEENGNFTRLYWSIRGRKFFYAGRRDTIKACIYVKDLVNFILYQLENGNQGVNRFNCAYSPAFTIERIVETMKQVTGLKRYIVRINGMLLLWIANIIKIFGGTKLGIHPDRVRKLMVSTNISGEKMKSSGYTFQYTFEEALADWYKENDCQFLR